MAEGGAARTLGGYRLQSQLAVGGMAEIYIAKTAGVGGFEKLVALKVIHPNFSEDPLFVQMLVDEAKLTVQLQHANIVQTFDLGCVDEQYYIAMELVDGVDLYKLLRAASERDIDFPFEVAAFIALETCNGLDYAHRKRDSQGRPLEIVHRDISPQNILVSTDGEVKIVDFGIAKAALRGRQTAAGVIKGKYYYMSPEQAWGDPIDARTDVFSTGILLYEMLIGQMLYLEEDLDALLDKVRKALIPPPSTKRPAVPPELEQIVMKALKKRGVDRHQSAGEMGAALTQWLRSAAPDFNRSRLASFCRDVLGDEPTTQTRDPRANTALTREMLAVDEHSLLFKLADLMKPPEPEPKAPGKAPAKAPAKAAPKPAAGAPARGRDQATSPVSLPEMRQALGDFEESDQTIVDSGSDTLMAHLERGARGVRDEATRPMSAPMVRDLGAQPLKDDPAREDASDKGDTGDKEDTHFGDTGESGDDEATLTGQASAAAGKALNRLRQVPTAKAMPTIAEDEEEERPLPGVRVQPRPGTAPPGNAPARPAPSARLTAPARAAGPISPSKPSKPSKPSLRPPPAKLESVPPMPAPPMAGTDEEDEETGQHIRPEALFKATHAPSTGRPTIEMRKRALPEPASADRSSDPTDDEPTPPPVSPMDPGDTSPTPVAVQLPPLAPPVLSSFDEPTRLPPAAPPPLISGVHAVEGWPFQASSVGDSPAPTMPGAIPSSGSRPGSHPVESGSTALVPKQGRTLLVAGVAAGVVLMAVLLGLLFSTSGPVRASIEVVSLPPGAEVRLDGTVVPRMTPLEITDVDAQTSHHVRVSMRGYDVWESDVRFDGAQHQSRVRLQAVLVPTVGSIDIASVPPGAEAIVNGRIRGVTPTTVGDLPPNDDVGIELRLRGYRVARRTVGWGGKRKLEVTIPLEKAK